MIYVCKEGEEGLPVGELLGDLTDELDAQDWVVEFACMGSKNYGYRTNKGKEACKVKGFTLNYANSKILNFDSMMDTVLNMNDPYSALYYTTNTAKIPSNKTTFELHSQEEIKRYSAVHTKRRVLLNLTTVRYGY